jgi:ribonuclease E
VGTVSLSLLRQISVQAAQNQLLEVRAYVPLEVSNFLLNKKRRELLDLEELYKFRIILTARDDLGPEDIQVEYLKREGAEPKPASESKAAPEAHPSSETKPPPGAKKSGEARRPSRPRRRSSKPKPPGKPPGEVPEAAPPAAPGPGEPESA